MVSFAIDSVDLDGAKWATRENVNAPQPLIDLNPVDADSFAFTPTADTYVDESQPTTSFGHATSMWVDSIPQKISYLKFKIAGLQGRTILGARLRMYQIDASAEGGQMFQTTNSWTENMTWNTHLATVGSSLGSFGSVSTNQWVDAYLNSVAIFPPNGTVSLPSGSPRTGRAHRST